jgi:hypothetical protein
MKKSLETYDLIDWWNTQFSTQEKEYIIQKYQPMMGIPDNCEDYPVFRFLIGVQSWFLDLKDAEISQKLLSKAESFITPSTPILDLHFFYSNSIKHYYKLRNVDVKFYNLAKENCLRQIQLSKLAKDQFLLEDWHILPRHLGFEQLSIILEKESKYKDAITLCQQAESIGWKGDWQKRIDRLSKKAE